MKFGVHLSISKGLLNVVKEAKKRKCETVQIFIQSPRSWTVSVFKPEEIAAFKRQLRKERIAPLIIHSPYLINLVSSNFSLRLKSALSIIEHLKVGRDLGADFLVTHPGSNSFLSPLAYQRLLLKSLEFVFERFSGTKPLLLLENVAQKDSYCSSFANLAEFVIESKLSEHLGICFDTAHAFAAGYDLSKPSGWKKIIAELKQNGGLNFLRLIHVNDSYHQLGSGRDKHADLGEGRIGEAGFLCLVSEPEFAELPAILETPKMTFEDDLRNLSFIKSLVKNSIQKAVN